MHFSYDENDDDEIVRNTNDDATVSRLSAIAKGYFADDFVKYFVRRPVERSPIMNRGTYIRQLVLDRLVHQFLELDIPDKEKQIISLGSGYDTRYFMLKQRGLDIGCYYEIDFPETIAKKASIVHRRKELNQYLTDARAVKGGMELVSKHYCLLGGDLREWDNITSRLLDHGFKVDAPTLVISECVLIYLDPLDSNRIVNWLTQELTDAMVALYEQIKPDDAFGRMMIHNLQSRHIELRGIHAYPELKDQEQRFLRLGWDDAKALDINMVHDTLLDPRDFSRMAKLEMLDEMEEWRLLSEHYCVAWAYKSSNAKGAFSSITLDKRLPHEGQTPEPQKKMGLSRLHLRA
ncbi:leucine carboxyl methyltransferase [Lichtheimia hyalospora FSU 10163]|nr:leucine carboxyl methyltransferase [Lichtheimia hyalospora FSU 10163]